MFRNLVFASFAAATIGNAFGYGNAGHQAIGTVAEHYLDGTRALTEVRKLLKPGENLDRAATWPDRAKLPDQYLTAEMKDFVANNPDHHRYHYCDIPFQQSAYKDGITGTDKRDIVHILEICIQVLQAPDDNRENPLKIDKRVALMLAAHLVGDLHQPLHVGCSYVDEKDEFVDPETGAKGQQDAGANYFHLKTRKGSPLHGYWDTQTVKSARDHLGVEDFPGALIKTYPSKPEWDGQGPVGTWPAQWATETLGLAKLCFKEITPRDRFLVPKDDKHEEHFEWVITLPPTYQDQSRDTVEVELSKAGYRLAALLKAVWPEKKEDAPKP
ncbi:MAG: S1/P1 nuclease [Luteolibacter sp.]|uniref:S1/P1 nuclease n=1 Tax=Luteolibacter sp. TaxID=1962973 RepID=UPI0032639D9A